MFNQHLRDPTRTLVINKTILMSNSKELIRFFQNKLQHFVPQIDHSRHFLEATGSEEIPQYCMDPIRKIVTEKSTFNS